MSGARGSIKAAAAPGELVAPGYLTTAGFAPLHGFTTRRGGLSQGAYASLNLGLSSGDERASVEANRDLLLEALGIGRDAVCAFNQVHGKAVLVGSPSWFEHDADGAVSDDPSLLLVVSAADCLPILFFDPASGAVGAAHAGWRGTYQGIAAAVIETMAERFGSDPAAIRVVLGPAILGCCYEVSPALARQFLEAGFPSEVVLPAAVGNPRLDLVAANRFTLRRAGVPDANIESLGRCTSCEPESFFSHRRDRGKTGRMWGFVRAAGPPPR